MLALAFPNIDPVIISLGIGSLAIRWYSLAYVVGILFGCFYANKLARRFNLNITKKNLEDVITWSIIGIVIGGRLGYVLFYDLAKYLDHPSKILAIYEGGLSFHGGLIGLITALYIFSRKYRVGFLEITDLVATVSPVGIFLGRIANFINAELYGRVTNVSWGVIFPNSDMQPRHPSQLYEAFGEGVVLFILINYLTFYYNTLKNAGFNSGFFLIFYSFCRIVIENFREPDVQLGFIWGDITMGQILTAPMLLLGIYLVLRSKWQSNHS